MRQNRFFPMVAFDEVTLDQANRCLVEWGHKMGPLNRPMNGTAITGGDTAFMLSHEQRPAGVIICSTLIRENVAGRLDLTRENTVELSRLCAPRRDLNRVILRLWREFVFPVLPYAFAISYQDAKLHTGDLYRFDGWIKIGASRSGPDRRAKGEQKSRSKVIWGWPQSIKSKGVASAESKEETGDGTPAPFLV